MSTAAKELLHKLLNVDVQSRISAQEAMQHRWFCSSSEGDSDGDGAVGVGQSKVIYYF